MVSGTCFLIGEQRESVRRGVWSKLSIQGRLGSAVVKRLPSAQGVIPEFRDRVPHRAPPLGACFFLSHSPAVFPLSLAVSLSHK